MTDTQDQPRWAVREQIVRDPASGLTLMFEVDDLGRPRLRIWGDSLPFGNREIGFTPDGQEAFAGTSVASCPTATWVRRP